MTPIKQKEPQKKKAEALSGANGFGLHKRLYSVENCNPLDKPAQESAVWVSAINQAERALMALAVDAGLSGLKTRQRTLTNKLRQALDTVAWLIDYECSEVAA